MCQETNNLKLLMMFIPTVFRKCIICYFICTISLSERLKLAEYQHSFMA
uniref:Uncharacterized protein n=1 Tax=Anguilla anguilla TaxID=7936 RepID=A0A0E9QD75_ANGAN